jgi:hypothetical protein
MRQRFKEVEAMERQTDDNFHAQFQEQLDSIRVMRDVKPRPGESDKKADSVKATLLKVINTLRDEGHIAIDSIEICGGEEEQPGDSEKKHPIEVEREHHAAVGKTAEELLDTIPNRKAPSGDSRKDKDSNKSVLLETEDKRPANYQRKEMSVTDMCHRMSAMIQDHTSNAKTMTSLPKIQDQTRNAQTTTNLPKIQDQTRNAQTTTSLPKIQDHTRNAQTTSLSKIQDHTRTAQTKSPLPKIQDQTRNAQTTTT